MSEDQKPAPVTLDYASPAPTDPVPPRILRIDGKTIISTIPMRLPKRCIKCNSEGAVRITQQFSMPAGAGLRIQATGHFSYCRKHYYARILYLLNCCLIGIAIFVFNILLLISSVRGWVSDLLIAPFAICVIFCPSAYAVIIFRRSRVLVVKHIDARWMWINGASELFLESLRREAEVL